MRRAIPGRALLKHRAAASKRVNHQPRALVGLVQQIRDELRRELAASTEDVAPRLVDDIQLLAVEGFHFLSLDFPGNAFKFAEVKTCICRMAI